MTISIRTATRNAMLDTISSAAGNGALVRIYDGSAPASANAALSGNTLLAEATGGTPFAAAASSATLTANSITQDSSANATGTASFFRIYDSGGTNCILQGSVGTSGQDMNLNTLSIVSGGPVSVTSFVLTAPNP